MMRMRTATVAVAMAAVLLAAVAGAARAGEARATPVERIETLDNGLKVIVQERHLAGVAAFRVYLPAGSLNEGPWTGAGVSHFLEHLVSGGTTPTRTEEAIRDTLDAIGAMTNAHTSKQFVCYHGQVGAGHIDRLVEIIADYVMHATITQKEFDREHEVVQREIERAEADPGRALWRLSDEQFFVRHPARHPVLGHAELVRNLTRDDLAAYHARVAVPDGAVAVAVGDFDADAVFETLRRVMGSWPRRHVAPTVLPERVPLTGPRYAEKALDVASVRRLLEFPTVQLTHPDLYPLDVLAFILGQGRSSRLMADLRERRGLVQGLACWSYTPAGFDGGRFVVFLQGEPEKADEARTRALEHLYRAAQERVTDEELARAKRQKIAEHVFGLQTCEDVATDLGTSALLVGDPHFSDRYVEGIQAVTADDVLRVARAYLRPARLCETVVRPKGAEAGTPDAVPGAAAPPPAAAGPPAIEARTLAGGVRLLLCPMPGHPTASLQFCLRGGLSVEDAETAGTSQFTARMLLKGAGGRSAEAIARTLDAMGAEMNASSGRNTLYLSARCLAGDVEATFGLAADALARPDFPAEEVERVRAQLLAELAQLADSPRGEAQQHFRETFFTDSPYRWPVQGREEVVRAVGRDALAAWHKRLVAGDNLVIAAFGGIDPDAVERMAEKAFGTLPAKAGVAFPTDAEPRTVKKREVHIKGTDKPIAIVTVAYPGYDLYAVEARAAMDVLDTIVSGYRMPGGWLHETLRGAGLVYEVHAYAMAGLRPGYIAAYAVCQPEKVPEVVGLIRRALARARTESYTPEQLEPARATIVTAKELGRETVDGWAFEAALDEVLGLGYRYAREEIDRVQAVTPKDVSAVADTYLTTPVICILTGDPEAAKAVKE